ncbi:MAG TPA: glycosyltransferase, partial [Candidatus Eisenbacteria bacterium]|nr:glycosyltransferase [Candidatus Eisenbacteria bacterium]
TLLIVPLWVGAGARVKMVEAFAARLPVVATTPAAEGLGLTPGTHYVAAETPAAIAEEAAALLHDAARREAIGAAGRDRAERHWSVEAVAALQSRLLASVSGAKREVAPPGAHG